ncbi:legumain-like, partial [Oppia nitens]|uniref:legumain-like n=1 Tax=Oppia nitens TaxID=1686743 RepID=UPI0023DCC967
LFYVSITVNSIPFKDGFEKSINGKTWVVLAAGSNEWDNYRHQADVYHAYQIVRSHGIPDENIIVFHYDDIADNENNPKPGKVFNKPNGPEVYHGVPKDYTGTDVTPENFLAALKGDLQLKANGKKVVESGSNDHIFIFFSDHGSNDLISFPDDILHGKQLNDALKEMHQNNRYGKLVFYVEACFSGSMFKNYLAKNMNIFVTTAANEKEESWACYCDTTDIDTCLGDLYSVSWMENSDNSNMSTETLQQQYEIVKQKTDSSHVCEYGDMTMGTLHLDQFQAKQKRYIYKTIESESIVPLASIASPNVPLILAQKRLLSAKNNEEIQFYSNKLERLVNGRQLVDKHFDAYVDSVSHLISGNKNDIINNIQEVNDGDCYRQLVDTFHHNCLNLGKNTYGLQKLQIFVNICEDLSNSSNKLVKTTETINILKDFCQNKFDVDIDYKIV